jgi:hypothetical protein
MASGLKWFTVVAVMGTLGLSSVGAQNLQTKRVMREKLAQSEQALEAVVTSNWAALDRHGRTLQALTQEPGWQVLQMPEYARQSEMFVRSTQEVIDAARMRDQETALRAYNGLVSSCVQCHRYVAWSRIVKR